MIKYGILYVSIFLLFLCSGTNDSTGKIKNAIEIQDKTELQITNSDSVTIRKLVSGKNVYRKHFFVDFDKDSVQELVILSESPEYSDCLTMGDSLCVYAYLNIYRYVKQEWKQVHEYKLPDLESTIIKTDSASDLIIRYKSRPSGYSRQEKTEIYRYKNDHYYLQMINLLIDTKANFSPGTDTDSWDYSIDLANRRVKIVYYRLREIEDDDGRSKLVSTDTTMFREISKDFFIVPGNGYFLDTLIGEENMIYYY